MGGAVVESRLTKFLVPVALIIRNGTSIPRHEIDTDQLSVFDKTAKHSSAMLTFQDGPELYHLCFCL
jgi:hypothetical protein